MGSRLRGNDDGGGMSDSGPEWWIGAGIQIV